MQMAPMQIAVDYEKPEEFAAKLRVAAACYPVLFTIPAKFGLMVAQRLDAADGVARDLAELRASRAAAQAALDEALRLHGETRAMCAKGEAMALRARHQLYASLMFLALGVVLLIAAVKQ